MNLPNIGNMTGKSRLKVGITMAVLAIFSFILGRRTDHNVHGSHFGHGSVTIASHPRLSATDAIDVAGLWLLTDDSLTTLRSTMDKVGPSELSHEVSETTWAMSLSATEVPLPNVSTKYFIGVRNTYPLETEHEFLSVGKGPLFPARADAKLIGWRILSIDSEEPYASLIKQFSPNALSGIVVAVEVDPDRWTHILFSVGKTIDGRIVLQHPWAFKDGTEAILAWCKVASNRNR